MVTLADRDKSYDKVVNKGFIKSKFTTFREDNGFITATMNKKTNMLVKMFNFNSTFNAQGRTPPYLCKFIASMSEVTLHQDLEKPSLLFQCELPSANEESSF